MIKVDKYLEKNNLNERFVFVFGLFVGVEGKY